VGQCFFWYRPTRVVPDKRLLSSCVMNDVLGGHSVVSKSKKNQGTDSRDSLGGGDNVKGSLENVSRCRLNAEKVRESQ